uniref:SMODS and SLOG-associating 2TM effector domain-containing protein n=1 Tax=viral metagenome TaxID=1070528 RepID=A0A6C0KWM9_9ZZZZ
MNEKKENGELIIPEWTQGHEKILIDWADKAMCYRWLHARSHQRFSKINTYFTIPVIIMSTLTGTANFAQDRVPEDYRGYYSMGVGFVNILAGIITTIQQFLKISELNEGHRVSAIAWDKFYRKIKVELSKPTTERQNITDFLKNCTEEFDRLMETSPIIQKQIIELFQKTFSAGKLTNEQKESFSKLKKPEICDSLESVQTSIYKEEEGKKLRTNYKQLLTDIVANNLNDSLQDVETQKIQLIEQFVSLFESEMMRKPTLNELCSNLVSDDTQIDKQFLDSYWHKQDSTVIHIENDESKNDEENLEMAVL